MKFILKIWIVCLSLLPLRINHALGHLMGLLLFYSNNQARRISLTNIQICFSDWNPAQQRELLKSSLIEMGKSLTEIAPLWRWEKDRVLKYLTVSNPELMEEALKSKKGVIFLTPHLGCWEIAGLYLGQNLPVTTLYQKPKMAGLDSVVREARERSGAQLVSTDRRGIMYLFKALKKGQSVGILPDQTPKLLSSGVFAPFFGRPALTMNLIASLGCKSDAMVIIGFAQRQAKGEGYYLHLMRGDKEIINQDPLKAAAALNLQVERLIHMAPEQYQWSYKRFKKVPPGLEKVY